MSKLLNVILICALIACLAFIYETNPYLFKKKAAVNNYQKTINIANAQAKLARIHCTDEATKKYDSTTGESMKAADEANQCMTNLIIKELGKGFAIEYQDDLYNDIFYLQQMVTKLNADYYYLNAYCKDNCGTLGNQLWRGNLLDANEKILAQLIFLNTNQNPY